MKTKNLRLHRQIWQPWGEEKVCARRLEYQPLSFTPLNIFSKHHKSIKYLGIAWHIIGLLDWINLICCDHRGHKCFYLSVFIIPLLPVWVWDWLQVCLSGCRLSPGADWFQPGSQGFKDRLLPVPEGSPPLSQTANNACLWKMCLFWINYVENARWWCLEVGKRGVSLSCCTRVSLGPGRNNWGLVQVLNVREVR